MEKEYIQNYKTNMAIKKSICNYYSKYENNDEHIFCLSGVLYCDLLSCKKQIDSKPIQYEGTGPFFGRCKIGSLFLESRKSNFEKSELIGKIIDTVVGSKTN